LGGVWGWPLVRSEIPTKTSEEVRLKSKDKREEQRGYETLKKANSMGFDQVTKSGKKRKGLEREKIGGES